MTPELQIEPCDDCKGPFEFWGMCTDARAYRCTTCQVIQFFSKDTPPDITAPENAVSSHTP